MRLAGLAAAACAAALLVLPACAGAATAHAVANQNRFGFPPTVDLTYDASPGEANRLTITAPPGTPGEIELRDPAAAVAPGPGCERIDDHGVMCSPRRLIGPTRTGAGRLRPHHREARGRRGRGERWRAACPPSCAGRPATTCCEGPRAPT